MPHYNFRNVFLASPGDLSEERRLFPSIINQVNDIKANSVGLHLKAVGWEDTLPNFGRPQELINRDVRTSDIFVMLLWKRWGTPSGEFTSGTEEEFSIAYDCYKQTNTPHLLLYFRSVPEPMMADPGEQLQKVIDFRVKIEAERTCLYKGYEDPRHWKELLITHLCLWLDQQKYGADFGIAQPQQQLEAVDEAQERILQLQEHLRSVQEKLETTQSKLRAEAVNRAADAVRLMDEGKLTLAEEMFAKSIDLYEEPEVLNTFGRFLLQIGSIDRARAKYERVLALADEYHHPPFRALALSGLGVVYRIQGDLDQSEKMHKEALEINLDLKNDRASAIEYKNLGTVNRIRGDLDQAETMYKKAITINEALDNKEGLAIDYSHIGGMRRRRGDLKWALAMYEKALAINKEINNKSAMASNYSNLGVVYRNLAIAPRGKASKRLTPGPEHKRSMLEIAEQMCNESLRLNTEMGIKQGLANNYGNLGNIFFARRDYEAAGEMYQRALSISRELGDREGLAINYNSMGRLYNVLGKWDDAKSQINKSLEINSELGSTYHYAVSYKQLGITFRKTGENSEAKQVWLRALENFEVIGMRRDIKTMRDWIKALPSRTESN